MSGRHFHLILRPLCSLPFPLKMTSEYGEDLPEQLLRCSDRGRRNSESPGKWTFHLLWLDLWIKKCICSSSSIKLGSQQAQSLLSIALQRTELHRYTLQMTFSSVKSYFLQITNLISVPVHHQGVRLFFNQGGAVVQLWIFLITGVHVLKLFNIILFEV